MVTKFMVEVVTTKLVEVRVESGYFPKHGGVEELGKIACAKANNPDIPATTNIRIVGAVEE